MKPSHAAAGVGIIVLMLAVVGSAFGEELVEAATGLDRNEDRAAAKELTERPSSAVTPVAAPTVGLVDRRIVLGHSAMGRPIQAAEMGDEASSNRLLVVGCIHGDECAGIAIARYLERATPPSGLALWILPDLNPDGLAADTRANGRGVDLNRNFPFKWRPIGAPGDAEYSGPRPLSEPEARIAYSLINRIRPQITVWFHQALGLVDESGGGIGIERRYARLVGLPLQRLPRYPGSATSWENHRFPRTTSFVVELPGGALSGRDADRYARALLQLARR